MAIRAQIFMMLIRGVVEIMIQNLLLHLKCAVHVEVVIIQLQILLFLVV